MQAFVFLSMAEDYYQSETWSLLDSTMEGFARRLSCDFMVK
jgi:hypothetical protein